MGTLTLSTEPATSTVNDRLEALAETALMADMAFKEAKEHAESTKAAFKKALEAAGKLNPDFKGIGVVRTVIKEVKRFDPKLAVQLLTVAEIAQYSALSGALVKDNVAPSVYALMQAPGTTSLELKVAD
jgi:hypothetical protein